jgi:hypothetical protein
MLVYHSFLMSDIGPSVIESALFLTDGVRNRRFFPFLVTVSQVFEEFTD